jgi:hypothetical protein
LHAALHRCKPVQASNLAKSAKKQGAWRDYDADLPAAKPLATAREDMLRLSVTARGGTMEKRAKVTRLVLEHVARADDAVGNFRDNGVSSEGLLMHPPLQAAALKVAREELQKAIGLIERTKWLADRR